VFESQINGCATAWASIAQLARMPRIMWLLPANAMRWGAGPRVGRTTTPLSLMLCAMPYDSTAGLYRPFEGRRLRIELYFKMSADVEKPQPRDRGGRACSHPEENSPGSPRAQIPGEPKYGVRWMPHMSDTCASNPCRPPEDGGKSPLSIEVGALSHQRDFFHKIRLSSGRHAGPAAWTPNSQVPEGFFPQ